MNKKVKTPRKVSLPVHKTPRRISVEELRENFKRKLSIPKDKDVVPIFDPMEKARNSISYTRKKSGVIFNESVNQHYCLWDSKFPENPERLTSIIKRCKELDLFSECEVLDSTSASQNYIQSIHTENLINILKSTQYITNNNELEEIASNYDSIYIHPKTFESSLIAAGCTLEIIKSVLEEKIQNGMALVRPPGHHAMVNEFCGYCYFNNVSLAAKYAIDELQLERILIVDWDVHHGQGIQRIFYDDPRVLYFSSHRYEHGLFWPHLRESDYDYVGTGKGLGYNFNIPLNETGLGNGDYLAYFHQILLPVAYEYNPQLVLVSAGYDAALGCPEGKMRVSPAFYSHLTKMLMTLANGKIVVVLEGGYCPESLSEGAAHTLRTLMGKPCPSLLHPIKPPTKSMQETILNVIYAHKPYWKCFRYQEIENCDVTHIPRIVCNHPPPIVGKFETRLKHESYPDEEKAILLEELKELKEGTCLKFSKHKVCLIYDKNMEKHLNLVQRNFPERPARTQEIMKRLEEFGIPNRVHSLESRKATDDEVQLVHDSKLTQLMKEVESLTPKKRHQLEKDYVSIYFHENTREAAYIATGCLLQVVDNVVQGESQSGVAVIRPPGHHAEEEEPYGFCIFNNVAIAASYTLEKYSLKRILIVDWDIHHGNGIQHMFESDPRVLYISIHLYKNGNFFPFSCEANSEYIGKGPGRGFNVNIPWSKSGMGDGDYISAFTQVVLPIAHEFDPELVLVSAGFDAAINDPLGGCCVTPECFGHMTHLLTTLANGRVILALEGGYNVASISHSMVMCTKALLGDPLPPLKDKLCPSNSAIQDIKEVIKVHKEFWRALCFQVAYLDKEMTNDNLIKLTEISTEENYINDEVDNELMFTPPQTPEHYKNQISPQTNKDTSIDDILNNFSNLSVSSGSSSTQSPFITPIAHSINNAQIKCDHGLLNLSKEDDIPKNTELTTTGSTGNNPSILGTGNDTGSPRPSASSDSQNISSTGDEDESMEEGLEGAVGGLEQTGMTIGQFFLGQQEMYAVVPLTGCPHLVEVMPVPARGLNVFAPCEECQDHSENWVCLTCYKVLCGRYVGEHMMFHGLTFDHHMVLSYADLSVWCYACESYIDNEVLREAKEAASKSKFGDEV